ncbi:MAG: carbohydrate porin [Betaproteobacteria bacterium]|nr:carbohydrate porin [Betaproteobacteria bacterium]
MPCPLRAAIAATVLLLASSAYAAQPTLSDVMAELARLSARIDQLERRNAELEAYRASIDAGLANENVSEKEPELTARLKSVEYTALDIQKQAKVIDSIEGFSAGGSFVMTGQKASGAGERCALLNYRADITVTTPTVKTGDIESKLFGHFRAGQGKGLAEKMTSFVGPNATAFQLGAVVPPETSAVLLAQAWYQADIPLPVGGFKPHSREKLTVNLGKMDPFAFFDQNAAGNDETRQFLASTFVHNALLDNPLAANVGADGFGFSPGVRVSYLNEHAKPERYRLSLGVFGAGESTSFNAPFRSPFVIAQAETEQRLFAGLVGNYRVLLWRNGQAPTFVRGETRPHAGIGLNFDQRLHDGIVAFGRFGVARGNRLPFDRTLSAGAEFSGSYWGRGGDAVGLALGVNHTSADFRALSASVDADGDGVPDFGYTASGSERVLEGYYRYRVNKRFELTPDLQVIGNPGGNAWAPAVKVLGLRAQITY